MESTQPMEQKQLDSLMDCDDASTCELSETALRHALANAINNTLEADEAQTGQIRHGQLRELLHQNNIPPDTPALHLTEKIDASTLRALQTAQSVTREEQPQLATLKLDLPDFIEQDRKPAASIALVDPVESMPEETIVDTHFPDHVAETEATDQLEMNQIIKALPVPPDEAKTFDEQETFLAMMGMATPHAPKPTTKKDTQKQTPTPTSSEAKKPRQPNRTLQVLDPGPSLPPIIAPTQTTQHPAHAKQIYTLMGLAGFFFVGIVAITLKLFVFTG